jgi:hypothetical protein
MSFSAYTGKVYDANKGHLNLNQTIRDGKADYDVSLDAGKFSYSIGMNGVSSSAFGVSLSASGSYINGFTIGGSSTNGDNINGFEININPYKIIPIVVGAGATVITTVGPYFAPAL